MKLPIRSASMMAVAVVVTVMPAGAAFAQEDGCVVVEGEGSAVGDVDCPEGDVGGEVEDRDDVEVLPGRIDRPLPAAEDPIEAAPAIQSRPAQLPATGTDADAALTAGLAALALGGGAVVATRRRQRTSS